jgi:ppGpp synthetase/RelA/SpoT-type nucleotidyltranferase
MATHNTRFPLLDEMSVQCWTRTPEQKLDEEEMMMIELIRSYPPEMRASIEHQIAYGAWERSKPSGNNQRLPF